MLGRFSYGRYHKLSNKLFKQYLYAPYKKFLHIDSSSIYRAIINEAIGTSQLLVSVMNMLSESLIIILLYLLLLYVNLKATIIITIFFLLLLSIIFLFITKKMEAVSSDKSRNLKKTYDILTNFFYNFKFLKLTSSENFFFKKFDKYVNNVTNAYIKNYTISNIPRLFLETIGFTVIIIFFLYILFYNHASLSFAITFISIYILALYRMLPSFNRLLSNYNTILFNYKSIEIISNELHSPIEQIGSKHLSLRKEIKIDNLSFYYNADKYILKNINMTIRKGSKIGIIGKSGSGKSTLLDLIMAFHTPISGRILIDDVELNCDIINSWRNIIGYIPQNIYLFNDTIEQNILFGRQLNKEQLAKVLQQAHIKYLLDENSKRERYIGEGGLMLSGGERQRIAIARALYGNPEVLIMDEATNSLDLEVENEIMEDIFNECVEKTIIVVSHRLNTVERCDNVYKLIDGYIKMVN
jgi:ATP-binding cassette subfamily B protein